MSEQQKTNLNGAVLIVMSVVLTASVAFLAWTAQAVYNLNAELSSVKRQQDVNTVSIKDINDKGSPLAQVIMVRLEELNKGQSRIEKALDEHMQQSHKP